ALFGFQFSLRSLALLPPIADNQRRRQYAYSGTASRWKRCLMICRPSKLALWFALSAAVLAVPMLVIAGSPSGKGPTRAKPPKFPKSVADLFSTDARASLQGDRPNVQTGGA